MRRASTILMVVLLFAFGAFDSSGLAPVRASTHSYAAAAKKTCHYVTKKVHGKKKRVKVCKTVRSKPTPTPSPTAEPSDFTFLWGSAVDAQGNVFVADRRQGQVIKLSPGGEILARWPVPPDPKVPVAPELFGVAVDPQGNVYVPESLAYRIVKLSPSGTVLAAWDTPNKDTTGQSLGPTGIALDGQGNIYITDFTNSHVEKFSPTGALLATYGKECEHASPGDSTCSDPDHIPPGQLNHPVGIALDAKGTMYINDHRSNRAVEYSPTGQQLAAFGPQLPAPYPELDLPQGIGVDGEGSIFIPDPLANTFIKLSSSGTPVDQWTPPTGYFAAGDPGIDAQGNVYVTINSFQSAPPAMVVKLSPSLQVLAMWR